MLPKHFVTDNTQDLVTVNSTIRKLWEAEGHNSLNGHKALSPADTEALWIENKPLVHEDARYEIKISWKKEIQLGNNYLMAFDRTTNTEKKQLLKDIELGKKYSQIIT